MGNTCSRLQLTYIGNSDGISMGTNGMRYSLQSRDLIADSIEVGIHLGIRCALHSYQPKTKYFE